MTQGVLIFAFNNEETDYVAMAAWSAQNIRQYLNLPVAVVTNDQSAIGNVAFEHVIVSAAETGGTRYFEDYNQTVTWHNAGRVNAYSLTPYEQTLVLDADYVVASNQLRRLLQSPQDFMCHRHAYDMTTGELLTSLNHFGRHSMPMWWATVMMFRKSITAQYIFDCMQMVRDNWQHYRNLYGITQLNYRNDFALSIALGILSGHTLSVDNIPWSLASVMPSTRLSENNRVYKLEYQDSQSKLKHIEFSGMDFHAMGKKHLEDVIANHS
jgi:hypothetical protein